MSLHYCTDDGENCVAHCDPILGTDLKLKSCLNCAAHLAKDLRCATRTFFNEKMLGKVPSLIYEDLLPHPRAKADPPPTK